MRHLAAALLAAPLAALAFAGAGTALAADGEYTLTIKDHKFEPATIEVPAGQKLVLIVHNQDPTPEEFESKELKVEKVIAGGKTGRVTLSPLKPGQYKFVGEFNEKTAQGTLIAK